MYEIKDLIKVLKSGNDGNEKSTKKTPIKRQELKQEMDRIGNLIICIILAIAAIIGNCFIQKKLEIGNSFQFLFFKKILDKF